MKSKKIEIEIVSPDLTDEMIKSIVDSIKSVIQEKHITDNLAFDIDGFRPIEEAIVTAGGISVQEINPKTMESKLCQGLFFAGEVLDLDAYTGGFNLQIAFSTGYLAGFYA
jgi:predicted flavoprotein YhiN